MENRSLLSMNLYSYCANNPLRYSDESGFSFIDSMGEVIRYGALIYQCGTGLLNGSLTTDDIQNDIKNYSSANTDPEVVNKAKLFSSYKGAFVVIVDAPAAFSFGQTLFLNNYEDEDTINHEFGHSLQEKELGSLVYTLGIAIPSVSYNIKDQRENLPDKLYYSMPWERSADWLGGVNRGYDYYTFGSTELSFRYYNYLKRVKEYFDSLGR